MKFNTQGLALVIVFQLIISGATLSITATNAGAVGLPCAIPETASEEVQIGGWVGTPLSYANSLSGDTYLTLGDVERSDFINAIAMQQY